MEKNDCVRWVMDMERLEELKAALQSALRSGSAREIHVEFEGTPRPSSALLQLMFSARATAMNAGMTIVFFGEAISAVSEFAKEAGMDIDCAIAEYAADRG